MLRGAQAGAGHNAAQLGAFTIRFAEPLSPALARCDAYVDLGLVSPLLVLLFAPVPREGKHHCSGAAALCILSSGDAPSGLQFHPPKTKTGLDIRGEAGLLLLMCKTVCYSTRK